MQFMLLLLAFFGYVALVGCSSNELPVHPGVGGLYKGPNSETIIKGPDGSVITAQEEGGAVLTHDLSQPIVVPDTLEVEQLQSVEPVSVTPVTAVAPVISVGHTVEIIQADPHIIETEIVDAPVVEPEQSSDLVGPSGSISIRGSSSIVSGPASTTISEPAKILVATPLVAAVPVISSVTTPLRVIPVIEPLVDLPEISLGPTVSTLTVGPPLTTATSSPILVSSTIPPAVISVPASFSTVPPPIGVVSTTVAPSLLASNLATSNIGASIQPASSYGVINNLDNTVSSTLRPDGVLSSTLTPLVSTQSIGGIVSTTPSTNLDIVNSRQLNINPSLIPSANIIPPEIGPLPPGAIDLGTTVTVSTTPRAPGLISPTESPNIQRISSGDSVILENNLASGQQTSIQADGRIGQLGTNQVHLAGNRPPSQYSIPLLRNTNPIPVGIPRDGLVGTQLANYGIDSSQIGLTNVPLSSVSGFRQTIDQEIDDVSLQLWNRYGRDLNEKKVKDQKKKNKQK